MQAQSDDVQTTGGRAATAQRFDGWRVVAGAFLAQGVAIGCTISGYSLFIESIEAELGATRAQANMGISILLFVGAGIGPFLGRAIDRGPARALMLAGVVWTAMGLAVLSQASSLLQCALVIAGMIGIGHAMFGPLPSMTILANWFIMRRGTAIGIAATGTTTAGFLIPPITASLIEHYTWRGALLAYAAGSAAIAVPAIWAWMVKRPEEVGQFPDGQPTAEVAALESSEHGDSAPPILRQPAFWLLAAIFGFIASASIVMITNLVPYASDLGIPRGRAAYVLSGVAIFTSMGKVLFGLLVDRIDKRAALWLALGLQTTGWLLFLSQPGFELFLVAAAFFGLGTGSMMPVQGAMLGAVFGRAVFGRVMGLMGPVMLIPLVVSPPLVGHLYDITGSYTLPLTLFLACFAIAATLLLFLRIPREA